MARYAGARFVLLGAMFALPHVSSMRDSFDVGGVLTASEEPRSNLETLSDAVEAAEEVAARSDRFKKGEHVWVRALPEQLKRVEDIEKMPHNEQWIIHGEVVVPRKVRWDTKTRPHTRRYEVEIKYSDYEGQEHSIFMDEDSQDIVSALKAMTLQEKHYPGSLELSVNGTDGFKVGDAIQVGFRNEVEKRTIADVEPGKVILNQAITNTFAEGSLIHKANPYHMHQLVKVRCTWCTRKDTDYREFFDKELAGQVTTVSEDFVDILVTERSQKKVNTRKGSSSGSDSSSDGEETDRSGSKRKRQRSVEFVTFREYLPFWHQNILGPAELSAWPTSQ